jgi:hypothetical protein
MKLNIGSGSNWSNHGWHSLDYRITKNTNKQITGKAHNINLKNSSCELLFCSHVIEHIPHIELEKNILEFNRILKKGGVIRILTPDLKKFAKAYVERDMSFFKRVSNEIGSLKKDLGLGGAFMNFIVSSGQDNIMMDNTLTKFIAGYAHVYLYDFTMLKTILNACGFKVKKKNFCQSKFKDFREPLRVKGLSSNWNNLNAKYFKKNKLVNYFDKKKGTYVKNFEMQGFDRDPTYSLIVEAEKIRNIKTKNKYRFTFNKNNNNEYSQSLLLNKNIKKKINILNKIK